MSGHVCQNWRSGLRVLCNALLANVLFNSILHRMLYVYLPKIHAVKIVLALTTYPLSTNSADMSRRSSRSFAHDGRACLPILMQLKISCMPKKSLQGSFSCLQGFTDTIMTKLSCEESRNFTCISICRSQKVSQFARCFI